MPAATPVSALIPAGTLPAGDTLIGPAVVTDGWNTVDVSFDIVNLAALLDLVVEYSIDGGTTWLPLAAVFGISGPSLDAHGVLQTMARFHVDFGDGSPAAQVRGTLTNHGLPLVTAGGSLQAA